MNQQAPTFCTIVAVAVWLTLPTMGRAQTTGSTLTLTRSDGRDAATAAVLFTRTFNAHIEGVTLAEALADISAKTGVRFAYSRSDIPLDRRVLLVADRIAVSDALAVLLLDTGCQAVASATGSIRLELRGSHQLAHAALRQGSGTITGRVIDAMTGQPLSDVLVTVPGTVIARTTSLDGSYVLRDVAPGHQTLSFRRLGYVAAARAADVGADSIVHVNIALAQSAAMLAPVVTTMTGDQHLLEMGNMIGTINGDSVVQTAPVTSLSDVIAARVPGVQVFDAGGLSGASPQITIRGKNSLTLSSQPLLVVDGVRVANSTFGSLPGDLYGNFGTASCRFNDLVPEDIESIQIVKGPSAATLYGTDAANGVIVVTTKHGVAGAPRWRAYGEQGALTISRDRFPEDLTGWGHTLDGTHTVRQCAALDVASGICAQDSISHFSPLRNASTTPLGTGSLQNYGVQVSGGSATRYFVSGDYQGQVGYFKLPDRDRALAFVERGAIGISSEELRPDGNDKAGIRSTLATDLASTAQLIASLSYLSANSHLPGGNALFAGMAGPGYRDTTDGWGFDFRPLRSFLVRNDQATDHFIGGLSSTWQPFQWWSVRATTGLDYANTAQNLLQRNEAIFGTGNRVSGKQANAQYSADIGTTASAALFTGLRVSTSVGAQYTRTVDRLTSANAVNLAPGATTIAGGQVIAQEATNEAIVAGAYVQEDLAWQQRLFVSVAARLDGASTFGSDFRTATYPKASVSWLVSSEPFWRALHAVSTFRLRGATGASGVEPPVNATQPSVALDPVFVDGTETVGGSVSSGNPRLKPERQREYEGGFDLGVFSDRIRVEGTYYHKQSTDALIATVFPTNAGGGGRVLNLGAVRNAGYEGLVSLEVLRGAPIEWSITANGSLNDSRLLRLGASNAPYLGGFGLPGWMEGFPLFSYFDQRYMYHDLNHNGIIEPGEVSLVDTAHHFLGTAYPRTQLTLGSTAAFFRQQLTLRTQLDMRGSFLLGNSTLFSQCEVGSCRAVVDPHSPLANQAALQAVNTLGTFVGYYSNGAFTRLREVSVTYSLPALAARTLHVRSAAVTLSGRNLALWTRYSGVDPEVQDYRQNSAFPEGAFFDVGGYPPPTYWLARVELGL